MSNTKRTAAEAERAASKRFVIGAAIVIFIIMLLVYTGIIPNDLHRFFLVTKSGSKWLGFISFAGAFYMVYKAHTAASSAKYWTAVLLLIALGIAVACGFDFSYFRLR